MVALFWPTANSTGREEWAGPAVCGQGGFRVGERGGAGGMAESNGIQVVVRLRPVNAKEKREGTPPVVSSNTAESTVTLVRSSGKGSSSQSRSTFKAGNVFGSFSTQEEVFDQTMPGILKDVLKGFESTVFAYGQTGTGKTHDGRAD